MHIDEVLKILHDVVRLVVFLFNSTVRNAAALGSLDVKHCIVMPLCPQSCY